MPFKIKLISIIFVLLMTLQMLPIAQIGSMLSSNQWTEELPHGDGCENGKPDMSKFHSVLPPDQYRVISFQKNEENRMNAFFSEIIPSNHSFDIDCPPPD